jgi:hypothetical protein
MKKRLNSISRVASKEDKTKDYYRIPSWQGTHTVHSSGATNLKDNQKMIPYLCTPEKGK